jgi:hypothetical protein
LIDVPAFGTSSPLYTKVLQLRQQVLRKPLNMNLFDEDLSKEYDETIIAIADGDKVIACA